MAAKSKSKKISKTPQPKKKIAAKAKPAPKQALSKKSLKDALAKAKKTAGKAIKSAAPKAKKAAQTLKAKAAKAVKTVKAAPKAVKETTEAIKAKAKATPKAAARTGDFSKYLGRFIWWELLSDAPEESIEFYTSVFGWKADTQSMGDHGDYTSLTAAGQKFGGISKSQAPGTHWMPCVAVADIDESVTTARGLGAQILVPPMPIPGTGRYAVFGDPVNASVSVMQPEVAPSVDPTLKRKPGQIDWTELVTSEVDKGGEFYAKLFGWNQTTMPMGDAEYHMLNQGETGAAGMTSAPPNTDLATGWISYVMVKDIDSTLTKAEKAGASVKLPPTDIPKMGQMAIFADPQGGVIGLFQPAGK